MNQPAPNSMRLRRMLLIGGLIAVLAIATIAYLTGGRYIATDDAYTQCARVDISADIAGRVTQVFVKDNQPVHRGDPLFALDDRDLSIAVTDARAELADARLKITALKATYLQKQADVRAAQETLAWREHELARQTQLAAKGIASQAQLDDARHAVDQARQQISAGHQGQLNIRAQLNNQPDLSIDDQPSVQHARAMLARAQLNLSYTVIKAPMDGTVAKVEQLQPGDYIKAATPVFALMSTQHIWVEANFKESDLLHLRPGQTATIDIDAFPDHLFHGHLASISPGTGASFSILPPENATGNWVKVVQRLPIRISIDDIDPKLPIGSGLSAVVEVDTHYDRMRALP